MMVEAAVKHGHPPLRLSFTHALRELHDVSEKPVASHKGVVPKRRGRTRLLASINFLQQGASVEIEDFLPAPLG